MKQLTDPPTEIEIAELMTAVNRYFFEPQKLAFRRLVFQRDCLIEQLKVANEHIKQLQILTKPKSLFE